MIERKFSVFSPFLELCFVLFHGRAGVLLTKLSSLVGWGMEALRGTVGLSLGVQGINIGPSTGGAGGGPEEGLRQPVPLTCNPCFCWIEKGSLIG